MLQQKLAADAAAIQHYFDEVFSALPKLPVTDAMRYALQGGKAVRGFLVLEGARLHGVAQEDALPVAAAIEAVHAYSLVHDDLPSMDDDDLRRGRPTVHCKWDEATAILAGDALQTLGFELTLKTGVVDARARLASSLAVAAGAQGMVRGQALDIAAETAAQPLTLDEIIDLQAGKTGALIEWSAAAGAVLGGTNPESMRRYGKALGLAFQIADDILDVEGDELVAGKRLQKDEGAGKATFVSLLGLETAKSRAETLVGDAERALKPYGPACDTLCELAHFVISRRN